MIRSRPPSPSASMDNHALERGRIKRSRAVLVCNRCKSLKTRCDLGRPCGSCVKAKAEDKCTYDPWRGSQAQRSLPVGAVPDHSNNNCDSAPSSLEDRLSHVEKSLAKIESLLSNTSRGHQNGSSPSRHSEEDVWSSLIAQLPPFSLAESLLRKYFTLDTMLRYTHQPSFTSRALKIYSISTGQARHDTDKESSSYLASLCLTMAIGTTLDDQHSNSESEQQSRNLRKQLISLHHRFYEISENLVPYRSKDSNPEFAYYHLHALMLRIQRAIMDDCSSLSQTWFAQGKLTNTALFLEFHRDPDDSDVQISPFWKELRRRIWWALSIGERIITEKLRLPSILPQSTVRKPVLIPDCDLREDITQSELNDQSLIGRIFTSSSTSIADLTPPEILVASTGKTAPAEWAFIDAKIDTTQIMTELSKLSRHSLVPNSPLPDIVLVDNLIERLDAQIPAHLRFDTLSTAQTRHCPLTAPDQPPWILAQACVSNTGKASVTLNAYQPYLSLCPRIPNNGQIVQHALEQSLAAAHRLIVSSEIFVWHVTLRWPEGRSLFSWNTGSKVFAAGVLVALAAIRDGPDHNGWRKWMGDLQSAEGLLQVLSDRTAKNLEGEWSACKSADLKALKILRQLHERAKSPARSTPPSSSGTMSIVNEEKLFDPYTTHEMSRISTLNNTPSQVDMTVDPDMAENFTLEDLEALLTQVYGKPQGGAG
ncbi:hypothetical protein I203_106847 [Kwoniella mangroviensis CBS 8507]|uniref:uncharacterized protein n=1 Tax=Kwoniella mangroviensis CBS 8507 TaxID=1296122 RepID=UPI00080D6FE0|nr:uncharacterized protein I203_08298 [Kwoniella mangroviensis CBS 8507]OCF62615.1 hypothetical protein I203_08298 [Kwoniella mangroviensis CBS 8507]